MLPSPAPTQQRLPGTAIAAAVLAMFSATFPAFFTLLMVIITAGELAATDWLFMLIPVLLSAGLVVGAVLLLLGRSWLALTLPAGALTVIVLAAYLDGASVGSPFYALSMLFALHTAVLAALPDVRRWVAGRRQAATATGPAAGS